MRRRGRSAFVVTGALGFVWLAVWAAVYRLPQDHPWFDQTERERVLREQAAEAPPAKGEPSRMSLRMRSTKVR